MFEIRLLPLAEQEISEAEDWYAQQSPNLGDDFHNDINAQLGRIAHHPRVYAVVRQDIRRAPLRQFPHGIFFRVRGETVFIVGVLHPSRHPDRLRNR